MRELLSMLAATLAIFVYLPLSAQSNFNCIKGDCYNGYGTCVLTSGSKYVGDFKNGKIHGKGIMYYQDGNKYIGHWVNMYKEGEGRMIFAGGDEYLGDFKKNKFHGHGVMTYASGDRFDGYWVDNYPSGRGTFYAVNGDRYEGWYDRGRKSGDGTMYYADGTWYEGQWRNDQRNGQGILYYTNGNSKAGAWENDRFIGDRPSAETIPESSYATAEKNPERNCNVIPCASGTGQFTYRDGSLYVGEFVNGDPQGEGKVQYASGDRYEGGWKRHAPHGKGVMYYKSGKVIGAMWEYGKPVEQLFNQNRPASTRVVTESTHETATSTASNPVAQGQHSNSTPNNNNNTTDSYNVNMLSEVKIYAVIVGAARYQHMPQLKYTDDDAYQLFAFLKSPEGGALPDEQMKVLIDEDATRNNILSAMRTVFLKADNNDVILFYFSGHGLQGAFLPIDFDGYKNSLRHEEIKELLKASEAKHKVVFADACHSGSLFNFKTPVQVALKQFYTAFEESAGGTALLMSSRSEEYSMEDGTLRSGIFSHFLVRGLKGEANKDRNHLITIQELFDYLHRNVREYTRQLQTPTLTGDYDSNMPVAVIR